MGGWGYICASLCSQLLQCHRSCCFSSQLLPARQLMSRFTPHTHVVAYAETPPHPPSLTDHCPFPLFPFHPKCAPLPTLRRSPFLRSEPVTWLQSVRGLGEDRGIVLCLHAIPVPAEGGGGAAKAPAVSRHLQPSDRAISWKHTHTHTEPALSQPFI